MNHSEVKEITKLVVEECLRPSDDMTLFAAQNLSRKVRNKAQEIGVKAVVAISNKAAHPILVECSDDALIGSYDIALNKAYTVVALKMSTKQLADLAKPGGSLYGIQFTNNGKIVVFGGGEVLTNKEGKIIGGIGVSGGNEQQDTLLAKYAKEIFEKGAC